MAKKTFQEAAHDLKETINAAISAFESAFPGMGVTLNRTPTSGGINMTIRPTETQSYTVKAGNTVPLAKSAAATNAPPAAATSGATTQH